METNSQMDNGRLTHTDENILHRLIFKGGGLRSSHVESVQKWCWIIDGLQVC